MVGGSLNRAGHVRVVGCSDAPKRHNHISGYNKAVKVQVRCVG